MSDTNVNDAARFGVAARSAEAVDARVQLESIVRFFSNLDAALERLEHGVDDPARQLSQLVREEMLQTLLRDVAERQRDDADVASDYGLPASGSRDIAGANGRTLKNMTKTVASLLRRRHGQ